VNEGPGELGTSSSDADEDVEWRQKYGRDVNKRYLERDELVLGR